MAPEIAAVPIRGLTNAETTDDGSAVLFEIESHTGRRQALACPVDQLTRMVMTLTAALQKAERQRGESTAQRAGEFQLTRALTNPRTVIGYEAGAVVLSLLPMKHLPLHLALSPDAARKVAADLIEAADKASS